MFDCKDRVLTPCGAGTIIYRRMRCPDYSEVECYSVLLDKTRKASELPPFPSTHGTIFRACDISKE